MSGANVDEHPLKATRNFPGGHKLKELRMRKAIEAVNFLEDFDGDAEISSALLRGSRSPGGHHNAGENSSRFGRTADLEE